MFGKRKERQLPSVKYRTQLLPIKVKLMKEIAKYFNCGKFEMSKTTIIHYPIGLGTLFPAQFDMIEGDEHKFKLTDSTRPYITIMRFDATDEISAVDDIHFLMTLLDYVDMDSRA